MKKGKRLTKAAMKPGTIRFIGASATDNGITACIANDKYIHPANTITVAYNGSVGEAFYQDNRFWASDDINVFYPKFELTEERALYIIPLIRQQGKKYAYSNKWTKEKMEADSISLPVIYNGSRQLDLAYMDAYIRELEAARIRELDKWLRVSGLDDCHLKTEEQKALDDWCERRVRTERRKIVDLFDVANTHCVLGEWVVGRNGKVPYVTASACNNSVSSYVDYKDKFIDHGNTIVIGGKTFVVTYQSEDFFSNDSHNLVLRLKDEQHRVRDVYLYLIGAINAGLSSQYSWGNSVSYKKIQKDEIAVPVLPSGDIDYDFMSRFIRATIKQSIRGMLEWKDREIAATRRAVGETLDISPEESDYDERIAAFEANDGEAR